MEATFGSRNTICNEAYATHLKDILWEPILIKLAPPQSVPMDFAAQPMVSLALDQLLVAIALSMVSVVYQQLIAAWAAIRLSEIVPLLAHQLSAYLL